MIYINVSSFMSEPDRWQIAKRTVGINQRIDYACSVMQRQIKMQKILHLLTCLVWFVSSPAPASLSSQSSCTLESPFRCKATAHRRVQKQPQTDCWGWPQARGTHTPLWLMPLDTATFDCSPRAICWSPGCQGPFHQHSCAGLLLLRGSLHICLG